MDSIITYVLLCGYTPFRSDDPKELVRETARGRLEFHDRYWKDVSEEGKLWALVLELANLVSDLLFPNLAKDFIRELVVIDPSKRLTAEQALHHPVSLKDSQR
jgi:calcium/calmodulin-dependent protein kinase I